MNNRLYARLAKTNLSKNRQNILPYLLSCIGTVMVFFIMDTLAQGNGFSQMAGSKAILMAMGMGSYVVGLFAVIFLIYSNSFLAKRRKKEFGLFQILGMEKKHLARILFFESFYLWAAATGIGIVFGVVLYRFLFLILAKLTRLPGTIGFVFSKKAAGNTILLFGAVFLLNFLINLGQIHVSQPVELLHGEAQGEKEPKTKLFTAVLGLIFLGIGYVIAWNCKNSMNALQEFFVAVPFVMAGTYLLFSAGSIAFLKLLKKNKKYYYQAGHFTSVSGMLYRMKQNAAGLSNICILSTGVLLVISVSTCLWAGMTEIVHTRFPHQISVQIYADSSVLLDDITPVSPKMIAELKAQIDQELEKEQVKKKYARDQRYDALYAEIHGNKIIKNDSTGTVSFSEILLMEHSEYERITGDTTVLRPGQVFVLTGQKEDFAYDTITFGEKTYEVKHLEQEQKNDILEQTNQAYEMLAVVFPDEEVAEAFYAASGEEPKTCSWEYVLDLDADAKTQVKVGEKITDLVENSSCPGSVEVREIQKDSLYSLYGSLLFLGIFVGILFLMGAVMIIYYKQISEGFDDRRRFQIMQKVGMSREEIKKSIQSQVLLVFFLPLAAAVLHTMVAFPLTKQMMVLLNFPDSPVFLAATILTIAVFTVIYLLVYLLTARAYYKIVE